MSVTFVDFFLVSGTMGVVAGCSTVFAQLVGRKLRSEKPLDGQSSEEDLRTW